MEGWVCSLTGVAAAGDATQLYPAWCSAGVDPATATYAQEVRHPCEGTLVTLQVETDGANGGLLQIYDVNGHDGGADVSSATAITDAILDALVADGKAKLIFAQSFAASGLTPWAPIGPRGFMKGLAARYVGPGTCSLNISVRGGYRKLNGTNS